MIKILNAKFVEKLLFKTSADMNYASKNNIFFSNVFSGATVYYQKIIIKAKYFIFYLYK